LEEICFTTHLIVAGPDVASGIDPDEISEYFEEVERAREEAGVRLKVGLEVDYFPGEERRIEAILEEHPFDIILGALHIVEGCDLGYRHGAYRFFSTRLLAKALKTYFRWFRKAVESGLFNVMAHPDYFKRYFPIMGLELPPSRIIALKPWRLWRP
jgi:histidinol-phosphatase (PHP family)